MLLIHYNGNDEAGNPATVSESTATATAEYSLPHLGQNLR